MSKVLVHPCKLRRLAVFHSLTLYLPLTRIKNYIHYCLFKISVLFQPFLKFWQATSVYKVACDSHPPVLFLLDLFNPSVISFQGRREEKKKTYHGLNFSHRQQGQHFSTSDRPFSLVWSRCLCNFVNVNVSSLVKLWPVNPYVSFITESFIPRKTRC